MPPSLLCETVTGRTLAELRDARDQVTGADMVELRLDGVADLDVAGALHGGRLPAIVTCRPVWEGGRFDGSEEERQRILAAALDLGASFVDIEWKAGFPDLVRQHAGRIVLSSHDFTGVPPDLTARTREMRSMRTAVIKVAVTTASLTDALPLLDIAQDGDAVVIGMGDAGVATRILAARFGSRWTYAGHAVAPGQIPAQTMIDRYRFRRIGTRTQIYGVVGSNVMHSLSPAMHNAAFESCGIDAVYVPLKAADFHDFLTFADALGVRGVSVTIPFKLDALRAAALCDGIARETGAANTLRRIGPGSNRGWEATNTDVDGFLEPLLDRLASGLPAGRREPGDLTLAGVRVSVLGAGGAARAVVVALASRGARVLVHARRHESAGELAASLDRDGASVAAGPWPPEPGSWDVLVNGTPLGGASAPDDTPLPGGPFGGWLVYDLTYGPSESRLLRDARDAGCVTLDGLPMLVAQAERQFEWWTGRRAPTGTMLDAIARDTGRGVPTHAGEQRHPVS